jgi:hypothetical protein
MGHHLVAITAGAEHCACGARAVRLVEHLVAVIFDAWGTPPAERTRRRRR